MCLHLVHKISCQFSRNSIIILNSDIALGLKFAVGIYWLMATWLKQKVGTHFSYCGVLYYVFLSIVMNTLLGSKLVFLLRSQKYTKISINSMTWLRSLVLNIGGNFIFNLTTTFFWFILTTEKLILHIFVMSIIIVNPLIHTQFHLSLIYCHINVY